MATSSKPYSEDGYDFNSSQKGLALLIINSKYQGRDEVRDGSERDEDMLRGMFDGLGFKTLVMRDLKAKTLLLQLQEVSRQELGDIDCLAIAISTHGTEAQNQEKTVEDVLYLYDDKIKTKLVIQIFSDEKCPSLRGKPRLVFVQACRGLKTDSGHRPTDEGSSSGDPTYSVHPRTNTPTGAGSFHQHQATSDIVVRPAPCYKDFMVMYATPPGYYAFRNPNTGSRFIKCLSDVFTDRDHFYRISEGEERPLSFAQQLTRVMALVTKETSDAPSKLEYHNKKQTPVIYSMLTKELCLRLRDTSNM